MRMMTMIRVLGFGSWLFVLAGFAVAALWPLCVSYYVALFSGSLSCSTLAIALYDSMERI